MTKKTKLILGSASLTAVIAIVPAAVISCGADTSTDNTTTVANNVSTLKKLNITADANADITAADAAKLLKSNSSNLDTLNNYFDTKLIVSAATNNGVKATYSASAAATKTSTTAVLASTTSDTSTTLVITVTMTLGSITSTQAVNVTGFPTQDQVANKGTLITLATNLSKLALTATSTETTKTPSEIHTEISKLTNPTLTDLNTYFDTTAMSTAISAASTTADPITATYAINTISPDNTTDGSINITVTLTVGTGSSLVSYTTILTINGFTSTNQAAINTYVAAFQASKDIKGVATVLASTISPTTGISMTDIAKYVSGIATLPTNVSATFAITNVANSTGSITLSITLTATNAITTTSTITITGFQTSAIALDALAKTIATSYVSTNQSTILPATAYATLKALETNGTLSISNFSTYFDTTSITTALATLAGTTSSIVLSLVSSDNITNGTLQFNLNLSFDGVTQHVAITLTGFKPTTPSEQTQANLAKLNVIKTNIDSLTIVTTTQTSKTPKTVQTEIGASPTLATLNAYFPTDGITTALIDGTTITDITAIVPITANIAAGTLDFTATLSLGSTVNNDLATLPITFTVGGFLTANQAAVNAYVDSINALTGDNVIKAKSATTSLPTTLTSDNFDQYLANVPTIPTGSGITLSFALTNPIPATGSVDITITASIVAPNAASSVASKVTVTGFITTNQAAVNAYVAKINALTGDSIITAKNVTTPSSSEITNANYLTYLNNVPTPTDGITLSFALTDPIPATGSVDITITASIAAPNAASSVASKVTVTGFITTNQAAVNAYVDSINTLTGDNVIKAKSVTTSLPTTLTSDNFDQYLANVPTIPTGSGITLSFALTDPIPATGSVDITITASIAAPNAATATTSKIVVSGFLTTNQIKINDFINKIDGFAHGTITGTNTILPSNLTSENIGTHLNGIPDSTGLVLTYTLSGPSDTNGTINITITASIAGSTAGTSKSILVSEFQTAQEALTKLASGLSAGTYSVKTGEESNIPTVAYDALKPLETAGTLTLSNFDTYISTDSITSAFTTAGIPISSISSITLSSVDSNTLAAGTLGVTLHLSFGGIKTTVLITISGFKQTPITAQKQDNLNTLNGIVSSLNTTSIVTTTETTKTSEEVYAIITKLPSPTLDELATYFPITGINALLTPSGATTSAITIKEPTTDNSSAGTLDFSLTLSLGSSDTATSVNATFTVSGFAKNSPAIELTGQISSNQLYYSNYWASTPTGTDITAWTTTKTGNVGHSLYFNNGTSTPEKSSTLTLTSSSTKDSADLPTFISNINWPKGLSNSDIVSWTETGVNETGTATYNIVLTNNRTAVLTVKGFMNSANSTILAGMTITLSGQDNILTPENGSKTIMSKTGLTDIGASIGWNNLVVSNFGGDQTYSIINSNPANGTADFLFTFPNGNVLLIPLTGYLTNSTIQTTATTIAQSISTNITADTKLSEFTNNQPITFKLNAIPSWIDSTKVIASIPSWVNKSEASVTIALPTYNSTANTLSSPTSAVVTVSINEISSNPATTTKFESAQNYFATSGIITAKLVDPASYKTIDDLWTAIQKAHLTGTNETINPDGSTTHSAGPTSIDGQQIFDVTLSSQNIFNWKNSSITYLTCAITNNTITLRIFINGNVWYDITVQQSDLTATTSTVSPKSTDTTKSTTTTGDTTPKATSSTSSSVTPKDTTSKSETK